MNIILNEVHECTSEYDLTLYCMSHILVNCDRLKVKTSNFSPQLSFHGQMLFWLWPFSEQKKIGRGKIEISFWLGNLHGPQIDYQDFS